jgi:hypothetical protein
MASVKFEMLKIWMYQTVLFLSQSGRCCTTGTSATSSGGSRSAAGIRKTIDVWYDWFFPVRTRKSWATAAEPARIRNVIQSSCPRSSRESSGAVIAAAEPTTAIR